MRQNSFLWSYKRCANRVRLCVFPDHSYFGGVQAGVVEDWSRDQLSHPFLPLIDKVCHIDIRNVCSRFCRRRSGIRHMDTIDDLHPAPHHTLGSFNPAANAVCTELRKFRETTTPSGLSRCTGTCSRITPASRKYHRSGHDVVSSCLPKVDLRVFIYCFDLRLMCR